MYVCKKCGHEIERNIPASEVGGSYTDFDMKDTKYCACWRCQNVVKEQHIDKIGRHVNCKMNLNAKYVLAILVVWSIFVTLTVYNI